MCLIWPIHFSACLVSKLQSWVWSSNMLIDICINTVKSRVLNLCHRWNESLHPILQIKLVDIELLFHYETWMIENILQDVFVSVLMSIKRKSCLCSDQTVLCIWVQVRDCRTTKQKWNNIVSWSDSEAKTQMSNKIADYFFPFKIHYTSAHGH